MLETDTSTRRERRIAARKAQLLEAAAHVFSQKGYEKATTKEIAEYADVSEGTLFNYFATKRELLIGVAKAYANEVAADIESVQGESFEDMLAQLAANRFRRGRERRLFMLFLYESRLNADVHQYYVQEALHQIIDALEQRLKALIEAGVMRPVDPALAARMMSATTMGFAALFELGISVGTTSPEKLGAAVTDIHLNGLRNGSEK
ncbi:MAG: TetR/AcrR family transcriptional regulator [Anaerolineaceae bacterium]|nr:TetR/AcrR family transcriptional regulator [Anaerolineaceae bacterium]